MSAYRNGINALLARKNANSYTLQQSNTAGGGNRVIGDGSTACTCVNVYASGSYTPRKVELELKKTGSPTGTLTVYIYNAATPGANTAPDDRDVTAVSTLDVSTLTTSYAFYPFTFTGAGAWTVNNSYQIVAYCTGGDGSNNISLNWTGFIGTGFSMWNRGGGPPGATNDAANWGQQDTNGGPTHKVYS